MLLSLFPPLSFAALGPCDAGSSGSAHLHSLEAAVLLETRAPDAVDLFLQLFLYPLLRLTAPSGPLEPNENAEYTPFLPVVLYIHKPVCPVQIDVEAVCFKTAQTASPARALCTSLRISCVMYRSSASASRGVSGPPMLKARTCSSVKPCCRRR